MNIFEFDPQIYPRKLWVSVNASTEELNKKFEETFEDLDYSYYAQVYHVQDNDSEFVGLLIRFFDLEAMATANIAHEASRAAMEIFDYCESRVDVANPEPFAYLVGWIAKCCDEVKNNLKKGVSNGKESV